MAARSAAELRRAEAFRRDYGAVQPHNPIVTPKTAAAAEGVMPSPERVAERLGELRGAVARVIAAEVEAEVEPDESRLGDLRWDLEEHLQAWIETPGFAEEDLETQVILAARALELSILSVVGWRDRPDPPWTHAPLPRDPAPPETAEATPAPPPPLAATPPPPPDPPDPPAPEPPPTEPPPPPPEPDLPPWERHPGARHHGGSGW
jgi:hypothetical protein